jgi:DNA-directed RNA polymerase, subunit A' (EC 2.7.7.6)
MPSPKRIGKLDFGLLSPKDVRKMSVCKVIWPDTYDDDGFPYSKGLMDPSLGVIDPGLRCKTCGQKSGDCPGHFGHIDLAKPVIHVGYTRLIRKLLRVSCRACGRLLLEPQEIEKFSALGDDPFSADVVSEKDIKKERVCPHCAEQQLKVNFEKPTTFMEAWTEDGRKTEHKLTPADIRARLERIPDDDLKILGSMQPWHAPSGRS